MYRRTRTSAMLAHATNDLDGVFRRLHLHFTVVTLADCRNDRVVQMLHLYNTIGEVQSRTKQLQINARMPELVAQRLCL